MAASKIAITIDDTILKRLDILVKSKTFPPVQVLSFFIHS